jgi:hypothetical protein
MTQDLRDLAHKLLTDRIVAYRSILAKVTGNVPSAVLLSQLLFHDGTGRSDGKDPGEPFHTTIENLERMTALTDRQQRYARKKLIELKLISTERQGQPYRIFYTIHHNHLIDLVIETLQKADPTKGHNQTLQNVNSGSDKTSDLDPTKGKPFNKEEDIKKEPNIKEPVSSSPSLDQTPLTQALSVISASFKLGTLDPTFKKYFLPIELKSIDPETRIVTLICPKENRDWLLDRITILSNALTPSIKFKPSGIELLTQ